MKDESFCSRLRQLQSSKRLTQTQIAKKIRASSCPITNREQNKGFPEREELRRLSSAFGVPSAELLSENEYRVPEPENTKKTKARKKAILVILAVSSLLSITLLAAAILYHPRPLSKYIPYGKASLKNADISNYDGSVVKIEDDKIYLFLNELLSIRVIPRYFFAEKVVSSFTINISFEEKDYHINNNYIIVGTERTYIQIADNDLYDLVKKYTGGLTQ